MKTGRLQIVYIPYIRNTLNGMILHFNMLLSEISVVLVAVNDVKDYLLNFWATSLS